VPHGPQDHRTLIMGGKGAVATPGADYQVQVTLRVITSMIDLGLDPRRDGWAGAY